MIWNIFSNKETYCETICINHILGLVAVDLDIFWKETNRTNFDWTMGLLWTCFFHTSINTILHAFELVFPWHIVDRWPEKRKTVVYVCKINICALNNLLVKISCTNKFKLNIFKYLHKCINILSAKVLILQKKVINILLRIRLRLRFRER